MQKKATKKKAAKKTATKQAKKNAAKRVKNTAAKQQPKVYYKLHALLHTVRAIGQYEDQLCTLLHEIERTGAADPKLHRELLGLLEEMPTVAYQADLNAVRGELGGAATNA